MGTARIVTDAGKAYIKAMGNRQGPHPLACELVATMLADWFELVTFQHAVITIDNRIDEIPFIRGGVAESGPAFVTKAVAGHTWGGSAEELNGLVNSDDISKLVVFDTWTRNCDRYPPDLNTRKPNPDNVFLEELTGSDAGKTRLIAMDHSHCFNCGRELSRSVSNIGYVKDDRLYGLFPNFVPHVRPTAVEAAIAKLLSLSKQEVLQFVNTIPPEWQVGPNARDSLVEFIVRRAEFVADTIMETLKKACWPLPLFDVKIEGENSK